jgi:hypothetical protein
MVDVFGGGGGFIMVNARWKIWRETILLALTRRTTNSQQ